MTPEQLSATAGIVLSLTFSYVPGLAPWYDKLTPTPKRLLMLGLLLAVAIGSLLWSCRTAVTVACVGLGWEAYLTAFIYAAIANQTAYALSPLSPERRALRKAVSRKNEPTPYLDPDHEPYNRTNQPQPPTDPRSRF